MAVSGWLAVGAIVVALAVLGGFYLHDLGRFLSRPPDPSVLAEMEAMQTAARIAHLTNAAEDHMDVFIRERQQHQKGRPQWPQEDTDERTGPW
ncbi:hypothetical protein [Amycolatopsis sp. NPDC059657]|uniref:hypothetical protein n=1 Tax=Amycolatopsis sp. NPDC059657 TaxID=3346899 RepID=UPI00366E5E72